MRAMLCLSLCVLGLGLSASAQKPIIITFDAPGAGTESGYGTFTSGITPTGTIAGYIIDNTYVWHGFLRAPDGKFTPINVPGSGGTGGGTFVDGISPEGATVGGWCNLISPNYECDGFLRAPDGKFTAVHVPGSGALGAAPSSMNVWGAISGNYLDAVNADHGFLRAPDGSIATFDAPGATTNVAWEGTIPIPFSGINLEGTITGYYTDTDDVLHGFLRALDGRIKSFDPPGSTDTLAEGINAAGTIVGQYADSSGVAHGFLRAPNGAYTTVDPPGSVYTFAVGINDAGAIAGLYYDTNWVPYGFSRSPDGKFTTFDLPGASGWQWWSHYAINQAGAIAGSYWDASGIGHGFLWIP